MTKRIIDHPTKPRGARTLVAARETTLQELLEGSKQYGPGASARNRAARETGEIPELPVIVPPPGSRISRASGAARGVDQKMLGRVRGLLAKDESTQFPEEAEALSAKAQELMNRYAFERALLDADAHRKQTASSIRMWLDAPYVEAKSHLVAAIAEANRCRSVFYSADKTKAKAPCYESSG